MSTDVARAARGKPVPAANLHLTLAFLGEVDETKSKLLPAIAAAVGGRAFRLRFDRVGAFPQARVAWAGSSKPAAELLGLQATLAGGLARRGFELEERPFAPHLTLARKAIVALPPAQIEPIEWEVAEFALVSTRAGRYDTVATWRLG